MSGSATLGELAALTAESRSPREYLAARTAWLEAMFDCDTVYQGAAVRSRPLGAFVTGIGERGAATCEARGYWPDRHAINRRAIACGGVAMDDELLTARERRERPFYREVMRPLGLESTLVTVVTIRGEALSSVYFGWTKRTRPSTRALEAMRAALPILALGERLHAGTPVTHVGLSPRERQVLGMLVRGLTNQEIALLLGTAIGTVKNQVASLLRKTGTSNRSELAYWAASLDA